MTGCFNRLATPSAAARPIRSLAPPGANGATRRTGRSGQSARAANGPESASVPAKMHKMRAAVDIGDSRAKNGIIGAKEGTMNRSVGVFAALLCFALAPHAAGAQAYPAKPVKILAPAQPGGGLDLIGRTVAEQLSRSLEQSFFVEN